jgi:type IV secretion system pilin
MVSCSILKLAYSTLNDIIYKEVIKYMKKAFITLLVSTVVLSGAISLYAAPVLAQAPQRESSTTILPEGDQIPHAECIKRILELDQNLDPVAEFKKKTAFEKETVLSCAIRTGRIHFWMIPYFIVYIIEFLIGISGLIAILFIVIGGYQLVISGANDQKDTAKNTIMHALMGLSIALVAWVIVNIVQYIVTI